MSSLPRSCIFCGGTPKTKEHIWPDWLKPYIPRELEYTESVSFTHHKDRVEKRVYKQTGDPHSRRLRVVCKACNTGWMSRIQQKTKRDLLPLILGESCSVSPAAINRICLWSAMATMVAEFQKPDNVGITADQRRHLKDNQTMPSGWKVWIGYYERDQWQAHWVHSAFAVAPSKDRSRSAESGIPIAPNTQTTTLVVGKLFVHTMSSTTDIANACEFTGTGAQKLLPIWPSRSLSIDWPPVRLTDNEADQASNVFFRFAKNCRPH